jgi:hypothetical protein
MAPLLGVSPFVMAKAVGCYIAAHARMLASGDGSARDSIREAREALWATEGCLGEGRWGYEFDVQTRWSYYPQGTPNIIATYFVARGLAEAHVVDGGLSLGAEIARSADFVLEELLTRGEDGREYVRYTPGSSTLVHNANVLGASLIAVHGVASRNADLLDQALEAALVSVERQCPDGGWAYGDSPRLAWRDSFHTAYVLDGLLTIWAATGDETIRVSLERGTSHWIRSFFGLGGEPLYYENRPYPLDAHVAATSVDVLCRLEAHGFADPGMPARVASRVREVLWDERHGRPYYQVHRFWRDRRHFVRWSDGHWAMAEGSLALEGKHMPNPLMGWLDARTGRMV